MNTFHGSVFTHLSLSCFPKFFWGKPWKGLPFARPCAWPPVVLAWTCHQGFSLHWPPSWGLCPVVSWHWKERERKGQAGWWLPSPLPAAAAGLHLKSWDYLWAPGTAHRILCLLKEIILWFGLKHLVFCNPTKWLELHLPLIGIQPDIKIEFQIFMEGLRQTPINTVFLCIWKNKLW